jgi:5'(3')-deoxyribonucleotidase
MAKILIDCDGVLSMFCEHLLAELKARSLPVPEAFTEYEIFNQLEDRVADIARQILNDGQFWNLMPRYEQAVAVIAAIKAAGHDIAVVTTPWSTCIGWEFCRRAWLMRNFGLRPKRMIAVHEKHWVHGDVFIDDKPAHIRDWTRAWPKGRAFLMNRPWSVSEEVPCPRINWDQEGVAALLSAAQSSS